MLYPKVKLKRFKGIIHREGTKFISELPKSFGKPAEIIALQNAGVIVVRKNGKGIYIRKDGRTIDVPECVVNIARILQKPKPQLGVSNLYFSQ